MRAVAALALTACVLEGSPDPWCELHPAGRVVTYDHIGAPGPLRGALVQAVVRREVEAYWPLLEWTDDPELADVVVGWAHLHRGALGTTVPGAVYLDAGTRWYLGTGPCVDAADMATVVRHELGHVVGLHHAPDPESYMFKYMSMCDVKVVSGCDLLPE